MLRSLGPSHSQPAVDIPKLSTLAHVSDLIRKHATDSGVTRKRLEELTMMLDIPSKDKQRVTEVLRMLTCSPEAEVTTKMWVELCVDFEEQAMAEGRIKSWWGGILLKLDRFPVSTFHNFEEYREVSWISAAFSIIMYVSFLCLVIVAFYSFATDATLTIRQQQAPNHYSDAHLDRFFFFFRTSSWANVLDPTIFTFEMSYYHKTVNESTGEATEEYVPVVAETVGHMDIDWWPVSVSRDIKGVRPASGADLQGAYYMSEFQQLEVRVVMCRNSSERLTPVCKSSEEIREVLHGGSVNLVDWTHDFHRTAPQSVYWALTDGQTKQVDLWYGRRTVTITGKHPFENDRIVHVSPFSHFTEQVVPAWSDGTLAVFWFSQDSEMLNEIYVRQSVTELLSMIGGNWASLLAVFGFIGLMWNRRRLSRKLAMLRKRTRELEDLRIASATDVMLTHSGT